VGKEKFPTAFLFCKNAMGFFSMAFFLPKGGNLVEQIEVFLEESEMPGMVQHIGGYADANEAAATSRDWKSGALNRADRFAWSTV
jgi:hypothetical protein